MVTFIKDTVEAYAASANLRRDATFIPDVEFKALDKSIASVITTLRNQLRELQRGGSNAGNGNGYCNGYGNRQQANGTNGNGYGHRQQLNDGQNGRQQWNNNPSVQEGDRKMDSATIKNAFAKKTGSVPMQYTNPLTAATTANATTAQTHATTDQEEQSTAMVQYQEENLASCVDMVTNIVAAHQDWYLRETGLEESFENMDICGFMAQIFYTNLDLLPNANGMDIQTKFFEMHVNAVQKREHWHTVSVTTVFSAASLAEPVTFGS